MTTKTLKEIAKRVLGIGVHGETFDKSLHTKDIYPDEWHCSLGDREDELYLYSWTKENGFELQTLPTQRKEIYASRRGEDAKGDVSYFDQEFLSTLPKGWYVLIYTDDVPTWDDSDREPMTSYDVFEIV